MKKEKIIVGVIVIILGIVILKSCGHRTGTCEICGSEEKLYTVKYDDGTKHKEKLCESCAENIAYNIALHNELYPDDKYKVKVK